jgi:hypothetical protein
VQVPGQELCDAVHRMIGNLLEHDVQISLWIEAIQFGGLDQAVDGGRSPPASEPAKAGPRFTACAVRPSRWRRCSAASTMTWPTSRTDRRSLRLDLRILLLSVRTIWGDRNAYQGATMGDRPHCPTNTSASRRLMGNIDKL